VLACDEAPGTGLLCNRWHWLARQMLVLTQHEAAGFGQLLLLVLACNAANGTDLLCSYWHWPVM
jgi:hypothetical protein